jgi:hypothetical protein
VDQAGLATADVKVDLYSANAIQLAVTASGPAFLVTSEPMYTGWQARVNGKPQPLVMTNGVFRGLFLPSGRSRIVMEYHSPHFALWLFLSTIVFLGALAAAAGTDGLTRLARLPRAMAAPFAAPARIEWLRFARRKVQHFRETEIVPRRTTIRSLLLLLLVTVLFYWKIVLTKQFSLLTESEGVSQAYSWLQFWTSTVRHGFLPLWDRYTLAGHSFAGEMQTAAFYPLHLLLALFPPGSSGFSPQLYHLWFVFAHFLGACFMFALVRELGLSRFAAYCRHLLSSADSSPNALAAWRVPSGCRWCFCFSARRSCGPLVKRYGTPPSPRCSDCPSSRAACTSSSCRRW